MSFSVKHVMPSAPSVSGPPANVTAFTMFVRIMPLQVVPSATVSVAGTVPSNTATSPGPGGTPPFHAVPSERSVTPELLR